MNNAMESTQREDPFSRVLAGMERALSASHIAAFPVECASLTDDIAKCAARMAKSESDFTHMPVRNVSGRVVGVLDREEISGFSGPIELHEAWFKKPLTIDAGTSLRDTIAKLRGAGFLLVSSVESGHPDGISGIINHSDIQKLPVRVLLFTQVSEVESRLRSRIDASTGWEETDAGKVARSQADEHRRRYRNDALPDLHYLNISQLGRLAFHCGALPNVGSDERAVMGDMARLRDIRNAVAHLGDLGSPDVMLDAFALVERILTVLSRA